MAGVWTGGRPLPWLLILGLFYLGSTQFHFISDSKSYAEAKSYCRQRFSDLATLHNESEMAAIMSISPRQDKAWIGLELGTARTWHWSEPDHAVDFFNWRPGEPANSNQDRCAAMDRQGEWFESDCSTRRSFVCDGGASLLYVASPKPWQNAQKHCRDLSLDLVSIHSPAQNQAIQGVIRNQNVWTGLFQDAWTWSDGSPSGFRFWKPNQPNYLTQQECVVTVLRNDGRWNDLRCTLTLTFFCQGPSKEAQTTAATSAVHLTTAAPQRQSTNPHDSQPTPTVAVTHPATLFRGTTNAVALTQPTMLVNATTKVNTVAHTRPTMLQNATTNTIATALTKPTTLLKTTTDATAVTLTRPTMLLNGTTNPTTDLETHPTMLLNATTNATTVMSSRPTTLLNATTTLPDMNATVQVTTDLNPAANRTTAGHTSPLTSSNQPPSPGEYVLIKESLTWLEALSYCRDHHADLADITSASSQEQAAERSRDASTPHVWLGLRYTCNFDFWFWTNSASLCYQNFGPGHGSGAAYGCGVTGAMEATGRQQWVGLPETRKLNFICRVCK